MKADNRGIVHYRRHFASPALSRRLSRDRWGRIATGDEVLSTIASSGALALLPRRRHYVIETVGNHYRHTLPPEQLDVAREVVGDLEPHYARAFDKVLSGTSAHLFNMMVMRSDVLDAYCSWLFPILFEVMHRHDPSAYDPFNARYPGRIGELLLDAFLDAEGIPYVELPTVSPEPVDWVRKGSAFLAAKFLGRKYDGSF